MKRKFLYLLLTLCLLGQCLPAFAAQAPVLERIAFSGATIVGSLRAMCTSTSWCWTTRRCRQS